MVEKDSVEYWQTKAVYWQSEAQRLQAAMIDRDILSGNISLNVVEESADSSKAGDK
ncbi:hypothetical protein [Rothia terrae]|uniref:Uncharacterized protein n=1 Tax=Rothia terrae TaxID=396015 RepID=A0A7H2BGB8_9MICC|nr:hypothetical protein [Rothia terrae]QNV38714.1 hypothetical protein IDM49_05595 [Rothia terrae]